MTVLHLEYRSRWTVADLEQIPAEFRAELVNGALVLNPARSKRHQLLIHRLIDQVESQLPEGWVCTSDFDVIFADDHTRRPGMAVVREASFDVNPTPPSEIAIIVEIVSPGSEGPDRNDKPEEYAAAGIPVYWRIETRGTLALVAYELVGDTYLEHSPATDIFTTRQPWPVRIDVPDLGRIGPKR
ncbi:Uma2 family endonuclease [Actinopolymorpha alba]|uniref:Uma2 family endonuclease n=1 Tax=Actinopolymorpha alba TaxID=533267 RepID=UPI00037A66F7|nr:Uma2 family endonuclease [Actinopolymorpha alba]